MLPVLIAGGGPVGLTLAGDLGRRGIACLLLEENAGVKQIPRAMGLAPLTLEQYRRWGLEQAVFDVSLPRDTPGDIVHVTRVFGHELARWPHPSISEVLSRTTGAHTLPFSPYSLTWCAQHRLEPVLRDHAARQPPVELRFGWRLESFEQDDEGVNALIAEVGGARRETVRARYLVGCDGGRSPVRHALGIAFGGRGVLGQVWGTWFRAPGLWDERPIRPGTMYWNYGPGCASVVYSIDARDEWWMNTYFRADEPFAEIDPVARIHASLGRALPVQILGHRAYKAFQLVADRFVSGRVLLAGDAAHLFVPPGGNGMNTGVQDAFNLGWKLHATLEGWGGDELLPSYEIERRPVAVRNTNRSADAYLAARKLFMMDPDIDLAGAVGEASREKWSRIVRESLAKKYAPEALVELAYADSPICANDLSPAGPSEPFPSAAPGCRAPHVWLADGRSTLDLLGTDRFTLLRFDPAVPIDSLTGAARARRVPLQCVDITDAPAARAYARPLVLVRPDAMVAWRGTSVPDDAFVLMDRLRGAQA